MRWSTGGLIISTFEMRIHVVLRKGFGPETVAEVVRVGRLTNVNEERARVYGIVTGDAEASAVPTLRAMPLVESVEVDEVKRALSR